MRSVKDYQVETVVASKRLKALMPEEVRQPLGFNVFQKCIQAESQWGRSRHIKLPAVTFGRLCIL